MDDRADDRVDDRGWPWFDGPAPEAGAEAACEPALARAYARCFRGDDGRRVLEHLRATTLGRAFGPDATEAQLRHAEGQRRLVAGIHRLVARGRGLAVGPDTALALDIDPDPTGEHR